MSLKILLHNSFRRCCRVTSLCSRSASSMSCRGGTTDWMSDWTCCFTAPRSGRTLDCFVPVSVEHNINSVILRACFQHCLHVRSPKVTAASGFPRACSACPSMIRNDDVALS